MREPAIEQNRADPAFKYIMKRAAESKGLRLLETEFSQTLRADLVLQVPLGLDLTNTLFDFFRRFNVLEFKGENDPLDEWSFVRNHVRTDLFCLQNDEADFDNTLNLIVSARLPEAFLSWAAQHGTLFEVDPARPWLRRVKGGFQEVIIVVCRDLPLEARYYEWLVFLPSDNQRWPELIRTLAQQGEWDWLQTVRNLHPQEYQKLMETRIDLKEFIDALDEVSPAERARLNREWGYVLERELPKIAQSDPAMFSQILSSIKPEERLSGLEPEERLSGLKPEERLSGLKPEEVLANYNSEERLSGLEPEERLSGLTPEQRARLKRLLEAEEQGGN